MNNRKSISSNSLLLIVSGLVVVLLIVLSIMSINNINEISSRIKSESAQLEDNKETLRALKELTSFRPELENAYDILAKQIPEEPSEDDLIVYIQNLSENSKNSIIEISFEDRKDKENLFEMPFVLSIYGKYSSLMELLNNVSNGERLIRINEIKIKEVGDNSGNLNTSIMASAFYK